MRSPLLIAVLRQVWHQGLVLSGALGLTLAFFLLLPLLQALSSSPTDTLTILQVDTVEQPPPPPPALEEPEPEQKQQEEQVPELAEAAAPLDLSMLEMALNPGFGDGLLTADLSAVLGNTLTAVASSAEAIFSEGDLEQKPRVIYQPGPVLNADLRKKAPGTVNIRFIVDESGRVESPLVASSSDPIFEKAALSAVKLWKFEPGRRNGKAVRSRMSVPITFPKG